MMVHSDNGTASGPRLGTAGRIAAQAVRPCTMRGHWALALVVIAGCSSADRPAQSPARPLVGAMSAAERAAPAATTPNQPARRVPLIVSRPRPFRLATITARSVASANGAAGSSGARSAEARPVNWEMPHAPDVPAAAMQPRLIAEIPGDAAADIRASLEGYLAAFNRHDAAALAAHWTAKGTSVDLASGDVTVGREAVHEVFTALFAQDASAEIDMKVESIRPVRDDVAVVDGVTRLSFAGEAPAASRFAAVMVREDGQWRLESMREAASGRQAAPEAGRPLDALDWLLGSWEDIGEGVTAGMQCFWSAGRGFLVRTHVVAVDDVPTARPAPGDERIPGLLHPGSGGPLELTEIIGWDPRERTIRSWVFTSAGGFAEGTWTRDGSAWTVRLEGRGHDAGRTCVCTIVPQGADGLTITCDSDVLAHLLPPACDFVRTARAQ